MKALVVHNCATSAYVRGLQYFFPDWEVRGVNDRLAFQWIRESAKPEFTRYVEQCDLCVTLPVTQNDILAPLLPRHAQRVPIPSFWFFGLQPDSFNLDGFVSVLGSGSTLYSKIAIAAFRSGRTAAQTVALFNGRIYQAFGFLGNFETESETLIRRYGKFGIDLSQSIGPWLSRGNFLYSYNHPRVDVLVEILARALMTARLLPDTTPWFSETAPITDDLREAIIWPVYPEIAERHGLEGSLVWRMGRSHDYRAIELREFVEMSFGQLAEKALPVIPDVDGWVRALETV